MAVSYESNPHDLHRKKHPSGVKTPLFFYSFGPAKAVPLLQNLSRWIRQTLPKAHAHFETFAAPFDYAQASL
jgi:hypothetical protein